MFVNSAWKLPRLVTTPSACAWRIALWKASGSLKDRTVLEIIPRPVSQYQARMDCILVPFRSSIDLDQLFSTLHSRGPLLATWTGMFLLRRIISRFVFPADPRMGPQILPLELKAALGESQVSAGKTAIH